MPELLRMYYRSDTPLPPCPNCRAPADHLCLMPFGATRADYTTHCLARRDLMDTVASTAVEIAGELEPGDA